MENDEVACADESGDVAPVPIREPMKELKQKEWRAACHSDQPCVIGDVTYPAPDGLDAADVLWWIDFTQTQVTASRNLLNSTIGPLVGVLVGGVVAFVATTASGAPWMNAAAAAGATVLVGLGLGWLLLRDSEHKPLEERFLLYRQRARDLGVL